MPIVNKATVALLAIPDAMMSTVSGLYDVLNAFELLSGMDDAVPRGSPFEVRIVGRDSEPVVTASGLPVRADIALADATEADVVIVPSLLVERGEWVQGRYPEVVQWLGQRHEDGALICSACSGVLLVAETGLLAGRDATVHWAYANTFRRNYPDVNLRIEEALLAAGDRNEFVMSGASASWSDLALYLIARIAGTTAAQAIANFLLLQWHTEGQAPYVAFVPRLDHGDGAVLRMQQWIASNLSARNPVEEMTLQSGLSERTFKRRFVQATGFTPINYVQQVRIESGKRLLERTDLSIDEISFQVGYMEPAAFRRIFRRTTRLTPGEYRRRFRTPFLMQARGAGRLAAG